jgi:hypothetical protein
MKFGSARACRARRLILRAVVAAEVGYRYRYRLPGPDTG